MSQQPNPNETFNRRINIIIAIMVALTAVISTFITKLENEASTESSKASVAEQQYYYQAIGKQLSGETEVNHAFGTVYQLWYQYEVQRLSAQKRGEPDAVQTYTNLRNATAETSNIFDPRYFNADTGNINLRLYEADLYRRTLYELEEKQAAAGEVSAAWADKSGQYSLQLTLLAVAGFLFGLALMTKGRIPTLIFALSGIGMVLVISLWAYQVSRTTVITRPVEAIVAFSQGASLLDQRDWQPAVDQLTLAITQAGIPPYGRAHLLRARAYSALGNFKAAITDYQVAITFGYSGDPTVQASLAQAYFSVGDFKNATRIGNEALANSPENLALQQQVILSTLASGYIRVASDQAMLMLENANKQAAQQKQIGDSNAVAEIVWLLNDAAYQYDGLGKLLESPSESPIRKNINDSISVRKKARELADQIRAAALAIKYDLDAGESAAIDPNARIDITAIIPSKTPDQQFIYKVDMELNYSQIKAGQLLSIVTYRNGLEEPSWNFVQPWNAPQATGKTTFTLSPSYSSLYIVPPGNYTVSIYLNNNLLANGEFSVGEVDEVTSFTIDSLFDGFDPYFGLSAGSEHQDAYTQIYDPAFFYDEDNSYLLFLEASYNYFADYCANDNSLNCLTASDLDGDGLPDEADACLTEPGPYEANGCPVSSEDADGDGLADNNDLCPYSFGSSEANGCPVTESDPDSDGDGTTDTIDTCPLEPGTADNGGCPLAENDADGDGLLNDQDLCPYVAGSEETNGCPTEGAEPDTDGDSVPDSLDFCPDAAGPADYNGCPSSTDDADGDGVTDTRDDCPFEIGPAENNGCPGSEQQEPDSDGDGISDSTDLCPIEAGVPENGGCPATTASDFDEDGVNDAEDACPYEPGPVDNRGCPTTPTDLD